MDFGVRPRVVLAVQVRLRAEVVRAVLLIRPVWASPSLHFYPCPFADSAHSPPLQPQARIRFVDGIGQDLFDEARTLGNVPLLPEAQEQAQLMRACT